MYFLLALAVLGANEVPDPKPLAMTSRVVQRVKQLVTYRTCVNGVCSTVTAEVAETTSVTAPQGTFSTFSEMPDPAPLRTRRTPVRTLVHGTVGGTLVATGAFLENIGLALQSVGSVLPFGGFRARRMCR